MPDIHDQLAWEENMVDNGVSRYRTQQDGAVEGGRGHETSAGSRLLRSYVLQVSDHIRAYLDGKLPNRRRSTYAKLIQTVDTDKTALFALKAIINTLYHPQPTQSICVNIGRHLEDELRFSKFNTDYKEYYDEIVRSWERKKTKDYMHKRRTLSVKSRDHGMEWEEWLPDTHMRVGAVVVSLLMEVCDLVETVRVPSKKKGHSPDVFLAPTQKCIEWVTNHNAHTELVAPDMMPCVIKPDDWTHWKQGGYYSPRLRKLAPLVKVRSNSAGREQATLLEDADLSQVFSAVNAMQSTPWCVNTAVLKVIREVWHKNLGIGMPKSQPYEIPQCPLPAGVKAKDLSSEDPLHQAFEEWKAVARELHTLEKERISQNAAISRVVRIANTMEKHEEFYYVYTCDTRGRVYATTSGLSPQGTDHGKALLQFANAKPLGPRGLYWLKVHGANKWGTDKCSRDEQVQWIEERHEDWLQCARDPIEHHSIWAGADKPYQFLAFCLEYAEASRVGDSFQSRLPIALDGTCNGLQHFSAMLRDEVGGAAVNLLPSERPSDIYQQVADVCTAKLRDTIALPPEEHAGAMNWLSLFASLSDGNMPRKLSKTPVMTLPYGSTSQACTETIFHWTLDNAPNFFDKSTQFRHALYLSPKLWSSISEVVIAARRAMDWIQDCASIMAKQNIPIQYTSAVGFPLYQATRKFTTYKIETQIGGRLQLRFAKQVDELDSRKQRQGSSPNLVHNTDPAHMMMCINAGVESGIDSFACIHDDFGVHACDTDTWHSIIQQEFVNLHENHDILAEFKEVHEQRHGIVLPDLPEKGNLDIRQVLQSPNFFG